MDRNQLRTLARIRLGDAKALLGRKRWSAAYYLCGYSVECGFKACLLRHLGESDAIFGDPDYLKHLSKCWTHNLVELVKLAGLDGPFGSSRGANSNLEYHWKITKDWNETSRYEEKTEADSRALYEAVSHNPDGVFRWIQSRW